MRLERNIVLLFTTRIVRLFAYGFLSIVLVLYLFEIGFDNIHVGILLTSTLLGDALISLLLTTFADRIGRRKMLLVGALLMILAGVVFVFTTNIVLLIIVAIIGVISPGGNEIGPFLSIEQAALAQLVSDERRTGFFAWYNLAGSLATALGALFGGWLSQIMRSSGVSSLHSYQVLLACYSLAGVILTILFFLLSPLVEAKLTNNDSLDGRILGLHKSRKTVFKLSALFALDAFAGGFVIQSLIVYWFHTHFGLDTGVLGSIFFGANILAGVSALLAVKISSKIGLINTMVFTHIPSNILLCLVPLMPFSWLAITVLLLRFSISQMDVPTRQSYIMAVVATDERAAASGITTIARSIGASVSPALASALMAIPWLMGVPFLIAGGLKIVYDLLLYNSFKSKKPPEEAK
ncbi:MAG: MFS transporter [Clostridiales bacterium 43-6]|nr:MAG: MFS transporter [Clostridiales bacterium 43-6]